MYNLREAEVLLAKNNPKASLELVNQYTINSKEYNTTQKINSLKAICFFNLGKKDSALYYSKQYLANYDKKNISKKSLIAVYNILSNLYYENKKIDSAFKYSKLTLTELNLTNKNKNEVNKMHYLHNYNDIQDLNKKIIQKEHKSNNIFFRVLLCILILGTGIIFYIYNRNKLIRKDLKKLKAKKSNLNIPQKKEYNIDDKLEKDIIDGIIEIKKTKEFLKADFNIQSLTKILNTNTSYLSYIINKEFKQSFKEHLTEIRIEYLIEKLKNNKEYKKYTIKFLAEEVGYTNASAFTRAFKKYKGITPSKFIKSLK
ncbi:helix-turn-helix domain-containing protein [uncultured Polaribacter sp.]|uniref:helix-turn-helix domain-containing protein n=1 Tax=uncultured Polaribacter sp. TaxID=174711 RepID=UPI00259BCFD9|nr:helix-turn-helix domain-containing protein [uncultured Polaribacter sp.]